jgi:chromosomal replication initiator protein
MGNPAVPIPIIDHDKSAASVSATPDLGRIWERVRRKLQTELGEDVVASWFGSLELSAIENGIAQLSVPTRFLQSWIGTHFSGRLHQHFAAECNAASVVVSVRSAAARPSEKGEAPLPPSLALPLDRQNTFDNFVVGGSNRFACAAARKIVETIGVHAVYNPLFIHAGVGLGKTHLTQAMAHACESEGKRPLYLTADRFMHQVVSALRAQTAIQFKDEMRRFDLLIVDDVQFLKGRTVQEEFCHVINQFGDSGQQMVFAADRPPGELDRIDERIKSRLAGGLSVELGNFDRDLRRRILERHIEAARRREPRFEVPEPVIELVASLITRNGRDLDGAVNRLLAHAGFSGQRMTVERAHNAIRDLIWVHEPKRVKVEEIVKLVSAHYNVARADLISARRTAEIVRPRQVAMYLSKTLTLRSFPDIAQRFGGRDHTTVLHAVRKIERLLGDTPALKNEIALLSRILSEQ